VEPHLLALHAQMGLGVSLRASSPSLVWLCHVEVERLQPVPVLGSAVIHLNSIKSIRKCESRGHWSNVQGQVVVSPEGWQKYASCSHFVRSGRAAVSCGRCCGVKSV